MIIQKGPEDTLHRLPRDLPDRIGEIDCEELCQKEKPGISPARTPEDMPGRGPERM